MSPPDLKQPEYAPASDARERFDMVQQQISEAASAGGRSAKSVQLIAVSKRHTVEKIRELAALGQRDFGENYLQEAMEKMDALAQDAAGDELRWHFIGHIQSRKCRDIAHRFDWVHTVDSVKVARKLSQHRADLDNAQPLNVLIQINIDDEESKSGIAPEAASDLVAELSGFEQIALRGLMMIPRAETGFERQRAVCCRLAQLLESLRKEMPEKNRSLFNQLSMGMSDDLKPAIMEGATMVRIGTALFGARPDRAPT